MIAISLTVMTVPSFCHLVTDCNRIARTSFKIKFFPHISKLFDDIYCNQSQIIKLSFLVSFDLIWQIISNNIFYYINEYESILKKYFFHDRTNTIWFEGYESRRHVSNKRRHRIIESPTSYWWCVVWELIIVHICKGFQQEHPLLLLYLQK